MAPLRRVGLLVDPHRLQRRERAYVLGVWRRASRAGAWQVELAAPTVRLVPGPYEGVLAIVGHDAAERLRASGLPAVLMGWRAYVVRPMARVAEDRRAAGRLAAAHLLARGYKAFAYFGFGKDTASRLERDAFAAWLRRAGHTVADRRVPHTYYAPAEEWSRKLEYVQAWIEQLGRPLGLFVATDALAADLAGVARRLRLRVPEDVGLIAAGGGPALCGFCRTPLTSVRFDYEQVGVRAAQLLGRLMDGGAPPRHAPLIEPRLVPAASTDTWGVKDPLVARALDFIARHHAEPIRVGHVVQTAGLSQRQLVRRMKECRGTTIQQELVAARVHAARRLLDTTDTPLAAIAREVGFATRQALRRAFVRHCGVPPSEHRGRGSG